ncbi:transmembrane protein 192-like [Dendronephthya gigantea]|uniref:transmembrane protein 192-like n=1 Tax=Dendronephthya gigantea TaxID=151771 RepID=UPI00106B7A73|nr:transmembrane protein 192-like [Dendronephthya gigantea]
MTIHFLLYLQHNHLFLHGYLQFCHTTKNLRLVPPLVLAFGNAIFLVFFSIMDHAWAQTTFRYYYFLQIVYSLEFLVVFPLVIYYIVKVLKFQREGSMPDCYMAAENNFQMEVEGEVGYSDGVWPNDVLEKQADMIRYLRQHNENLSRRLLGQRHAEC